MGLGGEEGKEKDEEGKAAERGKGRKSRKKSAPTFPVGEQ